MRRALLRSLLHLPSFFPSTAAHASIARVWCWRNAVALASNSEGFGRLAAAQQAAGRSLMGYGKDPGFNFRTTVIFLATALPPAVPARMRPP